MPIPVLQAHYLEEVVPAIMKSRGYKNKHQAAVVQKVVINSGLGATLDKSAIDDTAKEITALTGQKPIITKARKSVSNFKVREGMPLGVKVTLRGSNMYEFLYRLIGIALPGIRDFRGVSRKLDGHGNFTLGIADHTIFPEIRVDSGKRTIGLDISIITSATNDDESLELLSLIGMPFRVRSTES